MLKAIFIGGSRRGYQFIRQVAENIELVGMIILKDDSHEEQYTSLLEQFAHGQKVPFTVARSINTKAHREMIKEASPDLIIVFGWRTLIPKDIYQMPRLGSIALHHSLLPEYRGFAPGNWAIINGEKESGVTLFYLDEGVDSGDIIGSIRIPIGPDDTAIDFMEKVAGKSVDLIRTYLPQIESGTAPRIRQDESKATYCCSRVPKDGRIDWSRTAGEIHNLIRGLSPPHPGAYTFHDGKEIIICRSTIPARSKKYIGRVPGRIINIHNEGTDVLAADTYLTIHDIQIDGAKIKSNIYFKSIKERLGD